MPLLSTIAEDYLRKQLPADTATGGTVAKPISAPVTQPAMPLIKPTEIAKYGGTDTATGNAGIGFLNPVFAPYTPVKAYTDTGYTKPRPEAPLVPVAKSEQKAYAPNYSFVMPELDTYLTNNNNPVGGSEVEVGGGNLDIGPSGNVAGQGQISSMNDWLKQYYDLSLQEQLRMLGEKAEGSYSELAAEEQTTKDQYYTSRNQTSAEARINAQKLQAYLEHKGYAVGDQIKNATSLLSSRLQGEAQSVKGEQAALNDIARRRYEVGRDLASGQISAYNENQMGFIKDTIARYDADRDFAISQAGVTGFYMGQPTVDMMKLNQQRSEFEANLSFKAQTWLAEMDLDVAKFNAEQITRTLQDALLQQKIDENDYDALMRQWEIEAAADPNSIENLQKWANYQETLLDIEKKADSLVQGSKYLPDVKKYIEDNFYKQVWNADTYTYEQYFDVEKMPEFKNYINAQKNSGVISSAEATAMLSIYGAAETANHLNYGTGVAYPKGGSSIPGAVGAMVSNVTNSLPGLNEQINPPATQTNDNGIIRMAEDLRNAGSAKAQEWLAQNKQSIINNPALGWDYWTRLNALVGNSTQ